MRKKDLCLVVIISDAAVAREAIDKVLAIMADLVGRIRIRARFWIA
jgi:hypothetical protein